MKVLILGGFLGSGKTSLLLQLAYYITGHALNDKKYQVVILENEVGEEGIDDKLLRGNGYQVENLFSGCACCTLSGELLSTVSKIEKELQPDWLILETTGLAYPHLIQKNLADSMALSSRICIVADASRWERLLVPLHELITGQLINGIDYDVVEGFQQFRIVLIFILGCRQGAFIADNDASALVV